MGRSSYLPASVSDSDLKTELRLFNFIQCAIMEESSELPSAACSMNVTQNPFEADSLDSLHLAQCSPSVFAIKQKSTPASSVKKTPKFRWSIDQMAILHPVDIDELPYQQEDSKVDAETEEKIQAAIDQFFSQRQIIPSPWSEPNKKPLQRIPVSPTPTPPSSSAAAVDESDNSKEVIPQPKPKTANATCQTMLTLPLDFDLEALLGSEHFQYKEQSLNKSSDSAEIMSTSSLRRKLFSCGSSSPSQSSLSPPVSPVMSGGCRTSPASSRETMPFIISSPQLSPIRVVDDEVKPTPPEKSRMKTPGSGQSQFSSSPIGSNGTPISRLSSSDPTQLISPCMSPISKSDNSTRLSSTAASEPYTSNYTKSNYNGASLPDDSSISMSIMESPIQRSSINITRTTDISSKSCLSPFNNQDRRDKSCEESLETWSNHFCGSSQKLTSTMDPETVDSLRMAAFEPRMCSSRLIISAIQESKVQQSSSGIAANSDSGLTCLKEHKNNDAGFGSFKGHPNSRNNSSDAIVDEFRKAPPGLLFGQQLKAVPMDANCDSGFNTAGSVSSLEPTEMEVVEGR